MPVITVDQWKSAILAVKAHLHSAALKAVTEAFTVYMERKTQARLENLAAALEVWSTTGPLSERTTLSVARDDLRDTIVAERSSNAVINVRASNVGQNRYYELLPPAPAETWIPPVWTATDPEYLPGLKPAEIKRINEAFDRTARAATLARDEAIKIAAKSGLGTNAADVDFGQIFGIFDKPRAQRVARNFKDLTDALDMKVKLVDIRNSVNNNSNFAMCWPGHVSRDTGRRVTSRVDMFLGRGFFTAYDVGNLGKYKGTTASTVWTMVHELAHGTFYAVDAPPVQPDGNWQLQPKTDVAPDADEYGASPINSIQSNGEELDMRLATKDPTIAICNADSYGLFAFRCLMRAGES